MRVARGWTFCASRVATRWQPGTNSTDGSRYESGENSTLAEVRLGQEMVMVGQAQHELRVRRVVARLRVNVWRHLLQ